MIRDDIEDNPFAEPEGPPEVVVPSPDPPRFNRAESRPYRHETAVVLAEISSTVRRFNHALTTLMDGIDPRFAAEVRERAQGFLLSAAETAFRYLGTEAKKPHLTIVRGGRP